MPQEWELMELTMNRKETGNPDKPFQTTPYEAYVEGAEKFKE